jgi:nucleotide-binding universal stress UspA family protein
MLSRRALEWAVAEARLRDATVHVITAWEYPAVVVGMEGTLDTSEIESGARQGQVAALRRVAHDDIEVTAEVVQGGAARILIDSSTEAVLLVVGSRGHGGFAGLMLGSVSSQVVHHSVCTVVVVRDRTR